MIGVKIYSTPENIERALEQWRDFSIDTIFIGPKLRHESSFIQKLKENNLKVIAIFPVFYDRQRLVENPDEYAVTSNGSKASEEWVHFACPSSKTFMDYKLKELEDLMKSVKPDGVSLDFIRFFVFWEKVHEHSQMGLKQSCFDERCLHRFKTESGTHFPANAKSIPDRADWILKERLEVWTTWKCSVTEKTVKRLSNKILEIDPQAKIGLHSLPWLAEDFDGAVKTIGGQDLHKLAPYVDFFSPMCYSHMLIKTPEWINKITQEQTLTSGKAVIPAIQVATCYRDEAFPAPEFGQALSFAAQEPSQGIVYWSWEYLDQSEEKKAVIKKHAQQL